MSDEVHKLGEVLRSMGQTLEQDRRIRAAINQFARRAVVGMASSYGDSIVKLVSDTIRGWDAQTVTDRLEAAVGRDVGPALEKRVGVIFKDAVIFLRHDTFSQDFLTRNVHVVFAVVGFRGRGDDRRLETVVFLHAFG